MSPQQLWVLFLPQELPSQPWLPARGRRRMEAMNCSPLAPALGLGGWWWRLLGTGGDNGKHPVRAVHSPWATFIRTRSPPSGPPPIRGVVPKGPVTGLSTANSSEALPGLKQTKQSERFLPGKPVAPPEPGNVSSSLSEGPPVGFQLASSPRGSPPRAERSEEAVPSWEPSCRNIPAGTSGSLPR